VITPGIKALLDRLRAHKGEFYQTPDNFIRHKYLKTSHLQPCCPMSVMAGGCNNGDYDTFVAKLGLTPEEVGTFAYVADAGGRGLDHVKLRRAIEDACL
jgi:hypothetical protein